MQEATKSRNKALVIDLTEALLVFYSNSTVVQHISRQLFVVVAVIVPVNSRIGRTTM
jgi:hypothetical protein